MFIIITLLLTVLVSGIFGAVPAVVSHRRVSRRDAAWAAGLWLAVWVFALCAYHRPGLTVGFHAFRLAAMTGWAGLVTAGLRSLGRKGLKAVVPLLAVTALGLEVFVGNVAYFNTHSYTPFQLVDYLDDNINVGRGVGTISTRAAPICGSSTLTSPSTTCSLTVWSATTPSRSTPTAP